MNGDYGYFYAYYFTDIFGIFYFYFFIFSYSLKLLTSYSLILASENLLKLELKEKSDESSLHSLFSLVS